MARDEEARPAFPFLGVFARTPATASLPMKTVYLLRHAEAEPARYYDDDRDRELTTQGVRDARRLGRFLAATDQIPDRLITSSAVRARQTAEALPEGGTWMTDVPQRASHALYQAESADVLEEIQVTGAEAGSVLLVGHEPTWGTAVSQFVGAANVSLPAGTCVRIDAEVEMWDAVTFGTGTLRWMIPPQLLG